MNFFKKALIATAVVGTFGTVHAADLTDAVTKTSVQGLEVGAVADSSLRVIVREQLEAGDKITLVFGKDMFTNAPTGMLFASAATPTTLNINITYGSGTFTMGNATVTTTSGVTTAVFEVLTGDPVPKDASFEVGVFGTDLSVSKVSAASVTYSAVSGLTDLPKDTTGDNTGMLVVTANQYSATVKQQYAGIVNRTTQATFVSGAVDVTGATSTTKDTMIVDVTDNQALLSAVNFATNTFEVEVAGNFKDFVAGETVVTSVGDDTCAAATVAATKITVVCTGGANTTADDFNIELTKQAAASSVLPATTFSTDLEVDFGGAKAFSILDNADSGEWKIDATIINVPYFVVGKEGTSSSVHFSNLGPKADVIVEAVSVIDAAGDSVTYDAMDLGFDLAADSVTKVSQGHIISALGIPAGTQKLSVTFNIDGKATDVSAYAFTQSADGRSEISNSQQK